MHVIQGTGCGRGGGAESVGWGDGMGRRLCGSGEVMMMREGGQKMAVLVGVGAVLGAVL